MTSQEQYTIQEIEFYFGAGQFDKLSKLYCPFCDSPLFFSVAKEDHLSSNGRRRCGISIYCAGSCGRMLSHTDGYYPVWAENIYDWKEFSHKIYEKA